MREEIRLDIVVDIASDGVITVLEDLFLYDDGFHGATGNKFYPVPKTEYDDRMNRDFVIDYLVDSEIELPNERLRDECSRDGFGGMLDSMVDYEIEDLMWDTSYRELWDYLREVTGLDEDQAYMFERTDGGRCLPELGNQSSLWPEIKAFENKDTPIAKLQKIIKQLKKNLIS